MAFDAGRLFGHGSICHPSKRDRNATRELRIGRLKDGPRRACRIDVARAV